MMKRLAILLALVFTTSLAAAQSLQQYLALRKQHGVTGPAGVAALETLIGNRTLEVQGTVKGSFRVGDRAAVMVEKADGSTIVIDAHALPEWLLGNETPARLLVKAYRADEYASLRAILLGAAPESDVRKHEQAEETKRKAAEAAAAAKAKKSQTTASRGGSISGPIGRGTPQPPKNAPTRQWTLPASEVTPIYAAFIKKQNPRLPNSEALRIAQGIVGFSIQYGVDARLIMAMVMCESGFNPNAVSHAGAMGLGQLMPGTAQWMNVRDPFDTMDNLYGTVKLVRKHLDDYKAKTGKDFESLVLSLAAYNAGAGAVKKHGGVPPYKETQNYVRKVIALYYQFAGLS